MLVGAPNMIQCLMILPNYPRQLRSSAAHVWSSIAPYSIVYSCILYALRVCVYGYSVPIRLNFDADDGTNDTHDTQIQMSELVIKFLGYIFEYGALSPDHSRIHSSVGIPILSWCELPRNILNLLQSWGIP